MTPAEEQKRKDDAERHRRESLLALFLLLLQTTYKTLTQTVLGFLTGTVADTVLLAELTFTLTSAHMHASYFGRVLAGEPDLPTQADQERAAAVMVTQMLFLQNMARDLKHGRYLLTIAGEDGTGGGELPGDLAQRIALYVLRLRGTSNQAWVDSLAPTAVIWWRLGLNKNHCPSCPVYAAGSPYTPATLPTTPGSADCICLSACLCHLEIHGAAGGFPIVAGVI